LCRTVRGGITINKTKQNLGNDASTNIAQSFAASFDLGFFG